MRAPMQQGAFPFPVKYGYCAVGRVEAGPPGWTGRTVFALHPHQDVFDAPVGMLHVIPDKIPPRRATLAANMETALNAVWDSRAALGDKIVVVGAGLVGLLITALCCALPGSDVCVVDPQASRSALALSLGARFSLLGEIGSGDLGGADVVFHVSGNPDGLNRALRFAGDEARIVDVSWYGNRSTQLDLGGAFHSRRLRIISSQVGSVPAERRARWSNDRRMAKAISLLDDPRLDRLCTSEVMFDDLPSRIHELLSPTADGIVPLVRYQQA